MMLTSCGQPGDIIRCQALGIAAYLIKPIHQSELLDAILKAIGQRIVESRLLATNLAGEGQQEPEAFETQSGLKKIPSRFDSQQVKIVNPLSILLAEDNVVNQMLTVHMLEKWGHAVMVVGNGREALQALQRQSFDLVLMDVQMPEMDGFEATAEIRRREAQRTSSCQFRATDESNGEAEPDIRNPQHEPANAKPEIRRIPIIAMTAHAMKGDRERCLDGGMDGYISKPIQNKELFELIQLWASRSMETNEKAPPSSLVVQASEFAQRTPISALPATESEVLDTAAILERVDGDVKLLTEIADLFIHDSPKLLAEIQESVVRGDSLRLERAAHRLKGSAGNFGARTVYEKASRLEEMGREKDLRHAGEAYAELEEAMARLKPAVMGLGEERV